MIDQSVLEAIQDNEEAIKVLSKSVVTLTSLAETLGQHVAALELAARQLWVSNQETRDMIAKEIKHHTQGVS